VACSGQKLALVGRSPRDRREQNRSRQKCRLTRLVFRELLCRRSPAPAHPRNRHIRKRLSALVAHDKAGGLFLNRPGRREAAHRHAGPRARSATATLWLRRVQLRLARRRRLLPPQARGFREATVADWCEHYWPHGLRGNKLAAAARNI
jgi:hypothetical protein